MMVTDILEDIQKLYNKSLVTTYLESLFLLTDVVRLCGADMQSFSL